MYYKFDQLDDLSRIWLFQSTEYLEFEKVERISARLMNFVEGWQAHGNDLKASFTILHNRFVVVALDEASYQATGCSIDKLTHVIQALEKELQISLLDPTQIAFRDENGLIQTIHMVDFRAALDSGDFDQDTVVFNNLIELKRQLDNEHETNVARSWHRQWLPVA